MEIVALFMVVLILENITMLVFFNVPKATMISTKMGIWTHQYYHERQSDRQASAGQNWNMLDICDHHFTSDQICVIQILS